MIAVKSGIKLVIVFGILMLPITGKVYAKDKPVIPQASFYEDVTANSFEEALKNNERLRKRYETANAEQKQRMAESWQARKDRWDSLSDEEKAARKAKMEEHKAKMQERKAEWDSMSDEEKAAKKAMMQKNKANRGNKGGLEGKRQGKR